MAAAPPADAGSNVDLPPGCDPDVADAVAQYLRFDPRPETVAAVRALATGGADVVKAHFTPRIAFGTAGLRAAMAPG